MSGLAGLLAGRKEPGIYRWHGAFDIADVRARGRARAAGSFAWVDGWHHQDKKEFLDAAGQALGFPDDWGHTFDALGDCLPT